ncbi:hypothetical protein [Burkholderia sp. ABCPW 14]|uniref:hypothetical protein n=1 Tax=Burkholderia sp. ABCPW 14 TaxID=1637860 RepID=UPI0012E3518C|nr:hypothetical protein [Burkholderia sp. ABCPW 14]
MLLVKLRADVSVLRRRVAGSSWHTPRSSEKRAAARTRLEAEKKQPGRPIETMLLA